jgi:cell division protein FtsB
MKKKIRLLLYVVFFVFILLFFIFSDFGLLKRIELNSEKNKLLNIKQKETLIRDSLLSERKRFENDYIEIERIAREYYGYISPGEKVYILSKTK